MIEKPNLSELITILDDHQAIIHYGVPGMKWGVRKDRSPGRSLAKRLRKAQNTYRKARYKKEESYLKIEEAKETQRAFRAGEKKKVLMGAQFLGGIAATTLMAHRMETGPDRAKKKYDKYSKKVQKAIDDIADIKIKSFELDRKEWDAFQSQVFSDISTGRTKKRKTVYRNGKTVSIPDELTDVANLEIDELRKRYGR